MIDGGLIWPFLLVGLTAGGLYALLGAADVMVYRATGDLHIANGGIAMTAAMVFLVTMQWGSLWWVAPMTIALAAGLGAGLHRVVFSRIEQASMAAKVVVSLATGIGLQAVGGSLLVGSGLFDDSGRAAVSLFPESTRFSPFGASITLQQVALPVVAVVVVTALHLALHRTDFGLALRAAAQNPSAAELAGVPARRTTRLAWTLSGGIAGLAGVLSVSSATGLILPTYLFAENTRALAAALTGGFVDLRKMAVAAFALGVIEQELVGFSPPWNSLRGAVSFALITAVALFGVARIGGGERAEARA